MKSKTTKYTAAQRAVMQTMARDRNKSYWKGKTLEERRKVMKPAQEALARARKLKAKNAQQ